MTLDDLRRARATSASPADQGVGVLPYSPLALGAARRHPGPGHPPGAIADRATERRVDDNDADIVDTLRAVAAERSVPTARIALGWLLSKPTVSTPIVGATRPEHLDDALAAVELTLDAEEIACLEAPYRPRAPYGFS